MTRPATYVPPWGPQDCKIAFICEQPGKDEALRTRRPLTGPAGEEFDRILKDVGIARSECYLTNTIKDLDHPLTHYCVFQVRGQSRKLIGFTPAGQSYVNLLKEELQDVKANVLVACGAVALLALSERVGISKWRGSIIESTLLPGRKCLGTYHPATVIPPKNVYLNRWTIISDLKRAKEQAEYPWLPSLDLDLIVEPTFHECLLFLQSCLEHGKRGERIYYDIEISPQTMEVTCISFAFGHTSMSIPFWNAQGDYFILDQEAALWQGIARILEDATIEKGGQYITFDSHFLLRRYGIKCRNLHDTHIGFRILFPDYPAGLDFIQSIYTDLPYHKDDGKKHLKVVGEWRKFYIYNALDSVSCSMSMPKIEHDLKSQGNWETYERQRKLIPPLTYMMERGIRCNVEGMMAHRRRNESNIKDLEFRLWDEVGYRINWNSPKQLCNYFYKELKYEPYRKRGLDGNSSETCDDEALKRLSRKGAVAAQIIRDIKELANENSRYLSPYITRPDGRILWHKVDSDHRIRCEYKPVGAGTGRLASGENIFGTGMNMQNWPHSLLSYLLADEGYIYYSFDMSQIENRIVAYVGRVLQMIDAFERGIDLHRLTASLIFGKPIEEISDEPGSASLGGGKYSERFWGKKANHGLNYDFGYKAFAFLYEIPETQGKWIVDKYHSVYPGVRQNYHAMIRSQLRKDRTITNCRGRKRLFLDKLEDKTFKEAYAQIPQSSSADKVNEEGVEYIYYNDKFSPCELLTQVHDSVGFQVPLSLPWEEHARMLIDIKNSLESPFVWNDRSFVVPADLTIGLCLNKEECKELKAKNFPGDPALLAEKLHDIHLELSEPKGG